MAQANVPGNIILNGDLTTGSGDAPDNWRTAAWKDDPESVVFRWSHAPGAPAEVEVNAINPNDAYWAQKIHLAPGWYHFSALIRSEAVQSGNGGANLSILEDGIVSKQLYGTTDWQTVGFYLKAGASGADVELACRIGGFARVNTGRAFFRDIQAVAVDYPGADGPQYDLDVTRGGAATPAPQSTSRLSSWIILAVAVLFLAGQFGTRRFARYRGGGARSVRRRERGSPAQPPEARRVNLEPDRIAGAEQVESWSYLGVLAVAAAILWIALMATRRLEDTPYSFHFGPAFDGLRPLLATTGVAALKLWAFWAFSAAIVAGLLLQFDSQLGLGDALLGAAAGVWVIGYVLGQTLGPIWLFRPLTIWFLLAAGVFQIWRKPPAIPSTAMTPGQKMALVALGLLSVGMLPMQLGSPVAPYMDVLGCPASVQRIISFGVYHPFDNDAFGCFGARAQTPGFELFLAMLAMGGHVKLGALAQSATMLPVAALIIFATYRLGFTLASDSAGGMAALFLFFTLIIRRAAGMRGTAVDFALVGLGLAFFLDRRRSRTLTALGALILGASVAVHAIDGGLAILTAAAGALLWMAEGDYQRFMVAILCLAGSTLVALPELAIGLNRPIPYPLLPISLLAGIGLILLAVRWLGDREGRSLASDLPGGLSKALVVLLAAVLIYTHATHATPPTSILEQILNQGPLLFLFAMVGLVTWAAAGDSVLPANGASIVAFALLLGPLNELLGSYASTAGNEILRSGLSDIGLKLQEYWCPYFLVFPAAIPFALLHDAKRRTRLVVVLTLLTILIYPWRSWQNLSYDYSEHSISEEWGIGLSTARNGFWMGTHDNRWTLGPADHDLVDFLRKEQASGRVTTSTHVLHIAHDANVMGDFNHFPVFTGIDDDPVVDEISGPDVGWFAGSRVRPISRLHEALARHPQYILEQTAPPSWMKDPPEGYEQVFNEGGLRLFRRISAGSSNADQ